MNKKWNLLIYIALILTLSHFVSAVGILSPSSKVMVDYEPGAIKTFNYGVRSNMLSAMFVDLAPGGDFSEYVTLIPNRVFLEPGQSKPFLVTVNFPYEIELPPGQHNIRLSAIESPVGGGIAARASISTNIRVRIPYPGSYVQTDFKTHDVNTHEPVNFEVIIFNLGTNPLTNAKATIEVFDATDNLVTTLFVEEQSIEAMATGHFTRTLDTNMLPPGPYRAVATIYYFNDQTTIEKDFRIGSLDIDIINYTTMFIVDKINKVDVVVKSNWNSPINELYADIIFTKNDRSYSIRTPTANLAPWADQVLSSYWDTKELELGEYQVTVTVSYAEKQKTKTGPVFVLLEKKKFLEIPGLVSPTSILVLIILLLILADIIWMIKRKRKK